MTTFLSLDPGGTTGYAIFDYDDSNFEVIESGQIERGLEGFIDRWLNTGIGSCEFIVCESFTLREGIYGADLSPVYIIGALEALTGSDGPYPIHYQEPKLKALCDDARLKKLGIHQPGMPHRNDAVRHGIIHLRNNRHKPTLVAGWKE